MNSNYDINSMGVTQIIPPLLLLIVLVLSISTISAYPGFETIENVTCNAAVNTAGVPLSQVCAPLSFTVDTVGCHYYCTGSRILPREGPKSIEDVIDGLGIAGNNLHDLKVLREGILTSETRSQLRAHEEDLERYYKDILEYDPDNFWANWDYAELKKSQGDYAASDKLYYDAMAIQIQETRQKKMVTEYKKQNL